MPIFKDFTYNTYPKKYFFGFFLRNKLLALLCQPTLQTDSGSFALALNVPSLRCALCSCLSGMTIWCTLQGFCHSENLENLYEYYEYLIFLLFRICFHGSLGKNLINTRSIPHIKQTMNHRVGTDSGSEAGMTIRCT